MPVFAWKIEVNFLCKCNNCGLFEKRLRILGSTYFVG